jgi:molybdopterin biosynthesis enzyme
VPDLEGRGLAVEPAAVLVAAVVANDDTGITLPGCPAGCAADGVRVRPSVRLRQEPKNNGWKTKPKHCKRGSMKFAND